MSQREGWLCDLKIFPEYRAWKWLTADARQFVEDFRRELGKTDRKKEADIDKPFTTATKLLLQRLGYQTEAKQPRIKVTKKNRHPADIGFSAGGVRWIVEIKINLDFNSLGGAFLGGKAFRIAEPKTKFMLLCLYHKPETGDLRQVLDFCELHNVIHEIVVLTRNGEYEDTFYDTFARELNAFVKMLKKLS